MASEKLNCWKIIEFFLRISLGQSVYYLNYQENFKYLATSIMFIVWLQGTSIINKSFTELLLNKYFNVKLLPIVNDLGDLLDNHELGIAAENYWFYNVSSSLMEENEHAKLAKRKVDYPKNYMLDSSVFEDVVARNVVLLCETLMSKRFLDSYQNWHDKFTVGKFKMGTNYASFKLKKKSPLKKVLVYL